MKRNYTTISIPVKPYVRRFIEINYGDPADFSSHPYFLNQVRRMIIKPCRWREQMSTGRMKSYSTYINVLISEDDIERYGCIISKTDIIRFNRIFEYHIKFMMRSIVGIMIACGRSINESIQNFQDRYMMDESVWAFESIRKDYYRNGATYRIDFEKEIFNKIERIFLDNLSQKWDALSIPQIEGFRQLICTENE